jgi:hypothetical protein
MGRFANTTASQAQTAPFANAPFYEIEPQDIIQRGFPMAKAHKHGTMDTTAQEAAFEGFIRWSIRVSVFAIGALVFMAVFNS